MKLLNCFSLNDYALEIKGIYMKLQHFKKPDLIFLRQRILKENSLLNTGFKINCNSTSFYFKTQ